MTQFTPFPWIDVAIILALVLLNGVFAMSELAIVSARPARLEALARAGGRGAATAMRLASDPGKFLSTAQIGITLIGIVAGAYSGASLGSPVGERLSAWLGVAPETGETAGFAIVMFGLFLPLSFLIPSSSGLATVAMPIMAPLASFADVPAQLVVTAYQSASGIMNLFIPTSAVVMGGLAIARVPYGSYLRWVWPLLAILTLLSVVALAVGALVS